MFLRFNTRKKDGKIHRYWTIVENRRLRCERVTQRTVFYLGEINDTQQAAYTQPEPEHRLLLKKLGWELPSQSPPRIRAAHLKKEDTPRRDTNSEM